MNAPKDTFAAGVGGDSVITDPHHSRRDLAFVRRAIHEGWVSDERAVRILAEMEAITLDNNARPREKIAAAKVILTAAAIDAKRESTEKKTDNSGDEIEVKRQFAALALAEFQRRRKEQAKPVESVPTVPTG